MAELHLGHVFRLQAYTRHARAKDLARLLQGRPRLHQPNGRVEVAVLITRLRPRRLQAQHSHVLAVWGEGHRAHLRPVNGRADDLAAGGVHDAQGGVF